MFAGEEMTTKRVEGRFVDAVSWYSVICRCSLRCNAIVNKDEGTSLSPYFVNPKLQVMGPCRKATSMVK
jgi:hypothetical protein